MTKLLEEAIAAARNLPEDVQILAAKAVFMTIEHTNEQLGFE